MTLDQSQNKPIRYGKLTVLETITKDDDYYVVLKCRCSCGKIEYVRDTDLKNGYITICYDCYCKGENL
jgi:hypothetical protein